MELLILFIAAAYGLGRGVEDGVGEVRALWRGARDAHVQRRGHRQTLRGGGRGGVTTPAGPGRGHGTGRRVAKGAAATLHGTAAAARAANSVRREFTAGWRRGWPEGKERGAAWLGRQMATPDVDPAPATDPSLRPATLEPRPPQPPTNQPTTAQRSAPMTTTHTEITSIPAYMRELEDDIKRSASEIEDAQAGAQRAAQDVAHIDAVSASLAAMKLDPATLAETAARLETKLARRQAHLALLAAVEAEDGANQQALQGIQARHGAILEHADVVADRAAYQDS